MYAPRLTMYRILPLAAFFAILLSAGFALGAPAFDGGTTVQFNAEDNATSAYAANPAKLVYYEKSTVWGDIGGDWSLGTLKYSENGGTVEPGEPPEEPGESATKLKINTAWGGRGFAAFRMGSAVLGVGAGLDWDNLSLGFSGVSYPDLGYYWEGEVYSFSVPREYAGAMLAFDMKPWALGVSGKYTLAAIKTEDEIEDVSAAELALTNIEGLAGAFYRSDGTKFDLAAGVQMLKNRLEFTEPLMDVEGSDVAGMRILGRAGYRGMIGEKFALGANADLKFTPNFIVNDDNYDYDLADGDEMDIKVGPGFALYPDEKTTLAFDFNVSSRTINVNTLTEEGEVVTEYAFSEMWTYTQVGLERWLTDDFAAKAGWRQNIMTFPRNTMFAGACYKPNESWGFNYDYAEGTIGIDKVSPFMTLGDVITLGGHRMTVSYSF
jgi:hypothetical protein